MLRFLRIGFLERFTNELVLDNDTLEGSVCVFANGLMPDWRGPYNQVTSQSLSLFYVSSRDLLEGKQTYQFSDSGEIVLRLFLAFIHVLQEAFSKRALLGNSPRRVTTYRQEDQISSSFHS